MTRALSLAGLLDAEQAKRVERSRSENALLGTLPSTRICQVLTPLALWAAGRGCTLKQNRYGSTVSNAEWAGGNWLIENVSINVQAPDGGSGALLPSSWGHLEGLYLQMEPSEFDTQSVSVWGSHGTLFPRSTRAVFSLFSGPFVKINEQGHSVKSGQPLNRSPARKRWAFGNHVGSYYYITPEETKGTSSRALVSASDVLSAAELSIVGVAGCRAPTTFRSRPRRSRGLLSPVRRASSPPTGISMRCPPAMRRRY